MASRRQTGAPADHSAAPDALVTAAKNLLVDHFPSAITGRMLAESAGVQYGQLHRHFDSKTAVLAAAFEQLLLDFAETGTDEDGVPQPFGLADGSTFWRALTHLMLDRTTFESFRPSTGVLGQAALGVRSRRPDLDAQQSNAIVALGVSIELGVSIYRDVLGSAAGLDVDDPAIEHLVRQWLDGLYRGTGPLGAAPTIAAGADVAERATRSGDRLDAMTFGERNEDLTAEDRLVDAGARLLEDRAPSGISGRQLARLAGVNYGLIHHYFGTKDDVLRHSVQLHRDRFFAAYADERAPGYFSVCDHPGYVRATTWAAIDPTMSADDHRFPVMDLLLSQRLDAGTDRDSELATRVSVFTAVASQMAWALFGDVFERVLGTELARLEALVAPLLHRLLQAPQLEMGISG